MAYRKILVPFDGSRYSKRALNEAIGVAKHEGGTIYLCTVISVGSLVPPGSLLGLVKSASKGELRRRLLKSAKAEAERLEKAQISYCKSRGVKAYYKLVIDGNVAEEVLGIAKKMEADIIVIGSQGLHGIGKLRSLGSVSRKVSELATCPVLIVR